MYKELIDLLNEKISYYDALIKESSKNYYETKEIYDALKIKGKNLKKQNVLNICDDDNILEKLQKVLEKSNKIVYDNLISKLRMYNKYVNETDDMLSSFNLSKEIIYSEKFLDGLKNDISKKNIYENLLSMYQREKKLYELCSEIVFFTCNYLIDVHKQNIEEKEVLKEEKKKFEYALRKILKNENLISQDVVYITNLIDQIEDDDKANRLSMLLNDYIIKHNKKKKIEETDFKGNKKNNVTYVDDNIFIENKKEVDPIILNYIITLKTFNDVNSIYSFLDYIKQYSNIEKVINIIIKNLTEEDHKLKESLLLYYENIIRENNKENLDNEISNNKNTILYYGLSQKDNKILDDITKRNIPCEYYQDILKGIDILKVNLNSNKIKKIIDFNKVFEIRINYIRIFFKKLSNNTCVILGVINKTKNKEKEFINLLRKRDASFSIRIDTLNEARKIEDLWDDLTKENEEIEKQIQDVLKGNKHKLTN